MKIDREVLWTRKIECSGCTSQLTAEKGDVDVFCYEDSGSEFSVACPVCGTREKIPGKDVPPLVAQMAHAKRSR